MTCDMFGTTLKVGDTILVNVNEEIKPMKISHISMGGVISYTESLDYYLGHNYCEPAECVQWP